MRACELDEMRESHGECVRLESPGLADLLLFIIKKRRSFAIRQCLLSEL